MGFQAGDGSPNFFVHVDSRTTAISSVLTSTNLEGDIATNGVWTYNVGNEEVTEGKRKQGILNARLI